MKVRIKGHSAYRGQVCNAVRFEMTDPEDHGTGRHRTIPYLYRVDVNVGTAKKPKFQAINYSPELVEEVEC